jgi:phospholipid/cholesterol/gamma-HCH transport system ATP-binding protein
MSRAATQPGTPAIEMDAVTVSSLAYPDRAVIENINWTVKTGEFWVIAAMHGAGKSDLMSTAGGLMPPLGGNYRLFGNEMPIFDEHLLAERLRIGLVFESGQLLQHLNLRENIALPLRYHRPQADEHEVTAMVELAGLKALAGSLPAVVSRSWQKRAGLARALMLRPEILLIDNPLRGLDLRHTNWWINFLRELSQGHACMDHQPVTVVVTTDDLRPWQNFDAQFALLNDGHFTALGGKTDLPHHANPLVRELLPKTIPNN